MLPGKGMMITEYTFTVYADAVEFSSLDRRDIMMTEQHNKARTTKQLHRLRLREKPLPVGLAALQGWLQGLQSPA